MPKKTETFIFWPSDHTDFTSPKASCARSFQSSHRAAKGFAATVVSSMVSCPIAIASMLSYSERMIVDADRKLQPPLGARAGLAQGGQPLNVTSASVAQTR